MVWVTKDLAPSRNKRQVISSQHLGLRPRDVVGDVKRVTYVSEYSRKQHVPASKAMASLVSRRVEFHKSGTYNFGSKLLETDAIAGGTYVVVRSTLRSSPQSALINSKSLPINQTQHQCKCRVWRRCYWHRLSLQGGIPYS